MTHSIPIDDDETDELELPELEGLLDADKKASRSPGSWVTWKELESAWLAPEGELRPLAKLSPQERRKWELRKTEIQRAAAQFFERRNNPAPAATVLRPWVRVALYVLALLGVVSAASVLVFAVAFWR